MSSEHLTPPEQGAAASTNAQVKPSTGVTGSSKPPVTLQPSSHLDPGAYVRGAFPITIGNNVLIHPRAHLLSIHGPLNIADGCIISEKCVVGGPIPEQSASNETTSSSSEPEHEQMRTVIENHVHLHANATVECGAKVKAYAIIEPNTVIKSGGVVGSHAKVCGNLTVSYAVPDVTVVWGTDGNHQWRQRKLDHELSAKEAFQLTEGERLKAMQREREGATTMLKITAARAMTAGSRRAK